MISQESTGDVELVVAGARRLRDELLPKVSGPIEFTRHLTAEEAEVEGWYVGIARYKNIHIELFFDKFPGFKRRCFFVGFSCQNRRPIQALIKQCGNELQPIREFVEDDLSDDGALKIQLPDSFLCSPIFEKLDHENYFGIYDLGKRTEDGHLSPDFSALSNFLLNVLRYLPGFEVNELSDDYHGCENRQIVAWHLRRERDPELARRRKEHDGYRCQICKLKFEEVYGDIGRGFAEAHHRIPLSKLEGEVDHGIEDLITVCANCHRMLHRLSGEERDIGDLMQRIK
jgi:5-methylcytosine-specific restriction endonuclease McrA